MEYELIEPLLRRDPSMASWLFHVQQGVQLRPKSSN